jgi:hypothetical protein
MNKNLDGFLSNLKSAKKTRLTTAEIFRVTLLMQRGIIRKKGVNGIAIMGVG